MEKHTVRENIPSGAESPSLVSIGRRPIAARAKGGYLVHLVDLATGLALCGHKPRHTAKRMKRRSGWLPYGAVPPTCIKCEAAQPPATEAPERDPLTIDMFEDAQS
ncbi:hypothetical protein ACUXAV_005804 [Cupriavidus metallidurans]|jgi:hypothetical protein|uniref:Uncharacterized protein n=1 Tax=Cupriavidus metallidurans (strain ATCC 43123 / DSM 2839 / NBRC 102507 / CH34) TaxID=266264 RepID=Q1L9R6_CUPMC|nr:conserved hypothetical protein [Cupriavidus metallidurans CH34]